jgi:cbb3-type cytochrome c oxidase subunit III
MTKPLIWAGFIATLVMAGVMAIYTVREPARQEKAQAALIDESVAAATDLYAENCATCHGAAGEGIGAMPGLDNDGLRSMDAVALFNVIARGRYNTSMPAWAVEEGGVLTTAQVDQLVVLVQQADWGAVEQRVAELGLTPPTAAVVEVPEELLVEIANLPEGDALSQAVTLYAENCAACHGADLGGTSLAPSLTTPDLLSQSDEAIRLTINEGVPTTLMAGWSSVLTDEEVDELIGLMRRWEEVRQAGIEMPVVEAAPVESTPEMIAQGEQLYNVACQACHGADAYGTRMAPALNSQAFLSETPDAAIKQIISGGVSGTMMPAWGGRLDDAELNAIVAYLRSFEPSVSIIDDPTVNP